MSSILTIKERVDLATDIIQNWSGKANTYVGVGRLQNWSTNDLIIPSPNNTIDTINSIFDNLFAIKKVSAADMCGVVPRVDWIPNVVYDAYDNTVDMYSYMDVEQISNGTITTYTTNNQIVSSNSTFNYDFAAGSFISYYNPSTNITEMKEVVSINAAGDFMTVNSKPSFAITTTTYYNTSNTYPNYAQNFYVRNSYDQVYKCLFNNNGALSIEMPLITIGGQLPENRWIETGDLYKWKYMYTIPSGLKQKFFTTQWMPVSKDPVVTAAAVDGSIDIIKIANGGTGYNSNVACSNATIVTVTGNGEGANVSAYVSSSGTITDVTILSGGSGYTYANITVAPGLTGKSANLIPVISPHGGNGGNPAYELGATGFMLSVSLDADEHGTIPTTAVGGSGIFDYHQISIIKDPRLSSNTSNIASAINYNTTTKLTMTPFAPVDFQTGDIVFQGLTYANAYFTSSVINSDSINRIVYLNNIRGTFNSNDTIRTVNTGANVAPTSLVHSDIQIYTGDILYIQNRAAVDRSPNQTEQIKLIIQV